jgi:hypothetical protein
MKSVACPYPAAVGLSPESGSQRQGWAVVCPLRPAFGGSPAKLAGLAALPLHRGCSSRAPTAVWPSASLRFPSLALAQRNRTRMLSPVGW